MLISSKTTSIRFLIQSLIYLSAFLLCTSDEAIGAGFAVMEQSVKELGHAFSGAPTNIEDGSTVFFNPAAMNQTNGKLLSVAGYLIAPTATFKNETSQLSPLTGGESLRGGDGGDSAKLSLIPHIYYIQKLTRLITFGLGINTPFGMQNSYASNWKGRYQALDSELLTININPAFSFQMTENLSIGAGFNIQYLQSKLTNALDLGTVCLLSLGSTDCANRALLPQQADGHYKINGDSIGFGYNIGLFYTPNLDTRFGISYRSRVSHQIKASADFTIPENATILTRNGSFLDTNARISITMPDSVIFGFHHRINHSFAISGDIQWTNWSLIQELKTKFSSPHPDGIQSLKWKDAWRYALGLSYFPKVSKWTFRIGFAYDQSPIRDSSNDTPRIPDSDRYWLTTGFTYALLSSINIHGAYAHLFLDNPSINSVGTTGDRLVGQYTEQINIFGLQLDWSF